MSGKFRSAFADGIVVVGKSGDIAVGREQVRQVKVRRAASRLRNGGIGAAIGAGTGAAFVLIVSQAYEGDDLGLAILGAFTAFTALLGFGIGLIPPAHETVYKAER